MPTEKLFYTVTGAANAVLGSMTMLAPALNIWILEDDDGCRFVYEEVLRPTYHLTFFTSLGHFRATLADTAPPNYPAMLIADIFLPDGTLTQLLQHDFNPGALNIPLLVISSMDKEETLRFCFDQGAADYLIKPFHKSELVVKVERGLEKSAPAARSLRVDPRTLTVLRDLRPSEELTSRELQIMTVLTTNMPKAISRQDIIREVWGRTVVTAKTLDVHLANLRKKLAPLNAAIVHLPPHSYHLAVFPRANS